MLFNRFKSPIVIGLILLGYLSFGQSPWSAQFRPSINFPTEEFGEYDLTTGFGFEFTASYNLFSNFQVLAGWGHHTFQIHDLDYDLDESGYLLGINFIQSLKPDSPWSYN
ncbi:MAG: hypothetical protein R3213_08710, partial [Flavobacteriaceae bacterium]|nr:hypothetical protein [Flavobacteriaceae bacterium]